MRYTVLILLPFVAAIPAGNLAPRPAVNPVDRRSPVPGLLDSLTGSQQSSDQDYDDEVDGLLGGSILPGLL